MRKRIGNPHNEPHGKPMRVYDWIAPAGTDPNALPSLIETALPGLKLYHRGDNVVNGFINTSLRPDGSRYIAVHLYDTGCSDLQCPIVHKDDNGKPVVIQVAPTLTPLDEAKMKTAVGEHPQHRFRGTPAVTGELPSEEYKAVLRGVGFLDKDGPLKD